MELHSTLVFTKPNLLIVLLKNVRLNYDVINLQYFIYIYSKGSLSKLALYSLTVCIKGKTVTIPVNNKIEYDKLQYKRVLYPYPRARVMDRSRTLVSHQSCAPTC